MATVMEDDFLSRTRMLVGDDAINALKASRVAVFGVGGVGGYAVEVLARSGVGAIDLYDNDVVSVSNINRQILATTKTVGRSKVEVAAERIADINPQCQVRTFEMFFLPSNADDIDLGQYDYVVDAVDTVAAKLELVRRCTRQGVPIICSMGAANKLDASAFVVADISKTDVDPLARIMRKKLRKEGINHFKCVFSKEQPLDQGDEGELVKNGTRRAPASNAFVPAAAGIVLGGEVVLDIIRKATD